MEFEEYARILKKQIDVDIRHFHKTLLESRTEVTADEIAGVFFHHQGNDSAITPAEVYAAYAFLLNQELYFRPDGRNLRSQRKIFVRQSDEIIKLRWLLYCSARHGTDTPQNKALWSFVDKCRTLISVKEVGILHN